MGRAGKALGTRLRICFIYFAENYSSDRERLVFLCFMAREFFFCDFQKVAFNCNLNITLFLFLNSIFIQG